MDATKLLTADHNRVRGLFGRFKKAQEGEDTETMTSLASEIFQELEIHTTIEEEIFYPWAKRLSEEITETVDEGMEEHHVAKTLMSELREVEAGSDQWVAKMTVLIESVEHHAEEEEKEMFPGVRGKTSEDDRNSMGQRLDARKRTLGAPGLSATIDLTTEELRQLASQQQIPGRSKMKKEELAATVKPG
jgi:hemerythrin superfamily protein